MSESRGEPRQLGRYTLLGRLAGGGMGTVHLARARGERGFSRPVAIKLLHAHLAEDPDIVTRFLEEARVAALVKHPHVVQVLDVGETAGMPFLVLDYVHGESLEGLLRAARRAGEEVPLDIIAAIASDLLEGLQAAHDAKGDDGRSLDVVHRDVSPHNVLVSEHGIAYVTDFGIAKVRDRVRLTGTNDMLGKAGYMAPEQLGGPGGITPRTDLYGAGIVLWEALAGRKLFDGLEQQLLGMVEKNEAPRPSSERADVPPSLDALVVAMLARAPDQRPASAATCAEALAAALPRASAARVGEWMQHYAAERLARVDALLRAAPPITTSESLPSAHAVADPTPPPATSTRRTRFVVVFALLLALLAVVLFVSLLSRGKPAPSPVVEAPPPPPIPAAAIVEATTAASIAEVASSAPAARAPAHAPPRRANASAGTANASAAACKPPYEIVDGIKQYKRECFVGPLK